jgi:electron-transferring-flavoprotein dehydrogenase
MDRETMEFDVVVVGAGPAGLATACRLAQLAAAAGTELAIAVLEKAAEVGGHIVSGAVIDTRALDELFPDHAARGAPLGVPVSDDTMLWLAGPRRGLKIPGALVPGVLHNDGHRIASLGRLCKWLAAEADALGCHVFAGFAATEVLYGDGGEVVGVAT